MTMIPVHFEYLTGLHTPIFLNMLLTGSWDAAGRPDEHWTESLMSPFIAEDGCPAARGTVQLDDGAIGQEFHWGVFIDTPTRQHEWGIPNEVNDSSSRDRTCSFRLLQSGQTERFYLTHCRRLGANKVFPAGQTTPAIQFSVWAPNARNVELVRGEKAGGYIYDDGRGVTATLPMRRGEGGIWTTDPADSPEFRQFSRFVHSPYMFRITKDDGSVAYRTDLYSRSQIGGGDADPALDPTWSGRSQDLDGSKSCSVVVDPDRTTKWFRVERWPATDWVPDGAFWTDEFTAQHPLPARPEDLVIYELHVAGLGLDRRAPVGAIQDAMALLDYLADLGINAIELMPMSEFMLRAGWGYSTSHYMAIEYSGGGRDQFKHFIRECHRRGIAVILDVVYNHYTFSAERAEWAYDSNAPENNIYYWYEGRPADYPTPSGGYLDNGSSGWSPRFSDEMVRRMFISSAAALVSEFHFDGFRVDLTTAMHRDAVVHVDDRVPDGSRPAAVQARLFGQKFLREWTRTLKLIRPGIFLIAEDHSGWPAVVQPADQNGLGFDVTWFAEFYHQLIGDAQNDPARARLLKMAGYGDDRPLAMDFFAGGVLQSDPGKVIYHESHDEAGNSSFDEGGRQQRSGRTIMVAVNNAPLVGATRRYAEARVRFAAGMTLLARGVPMFFMGEEVGASLPYRYSDFLAAREDFHALRRGAGKQLFRYYAELIRLRLGNAVLRSNNVSILYTHDVDRVIAFRRWDVTGEALVVASLNNSSFTNGYRILNPGIIAGKWREIFNSDATVFGGSGLANRDPIVSQSGEITVMLPPNSVLVFEIKQ